ncbi:hypothetical protein GCM10009846_26550 [Agrococcus versicolor]|uniref:SIR2-like domain-containing protein n=1 Tax=Agrococcus versicolor TaxID=501482 RepID=A0ABP5MM28_9MICO
MQPVAHVGIDLAWGLRGRTGIAAVDSSGALTASDTLSTDDEIAAWIERHAPRTGVVAMDAPLVVANPAGSRPCEKLLHAVFGRFDAGGYPSNTSNPHFDPPRALTLARRLGLSIDPALPHREHVAIEVYPHPAMIGIFELGRTLKYKRKKQSAELQLAETRRLLDLMEGIAELRLGDSRDWARIREVVDASTSRGALGSVEDEIDGIFCAHLAWLWAQRPSALQVYGDVETGYIVAPPPPTWAPTARLTQPRRIGDDEETLPPAGLEDTMTEDQPRRHASHVFVTRGSLLSFACDAWLLPSDLRGEVTEAWRIPDVRQRVRRSLTDAYESGDRLAVPLAALKDDAEHGPLPILTAVPFAGVTATGGPEHLDRAVREFIAVAAAAVGSKPSSTSRPVPLLAMPTFGTGAGGGGSIRGEVLAIILRAASVAAAQHGVDVAIVIKDAATFAHVQMVRRQLEGGERDPWASLSEVQRDAIPELAGLARAGRLVPFMGAGVSVSGGGPTWRGLIERLAQRVGLGTDEVEAILEQGRSPLDQAAILEHRFAEAASGERDAFRQAIADEANLDRYGLAPALLATLAPPQAITLNYDELYERATKDIGGDRVAVISDGQLEAGASRWLLKLHGSVGRPESIVLTRDDYLGYNATRSALSSIVKANLITHHLLFVGFGFTDDHFHEIVHDVRSAVQRSDGVPFATALQLRVDPLDALLLGRTARSIDMGISQLEQGEDAIAWAGRQVEIFLDALVAHAADSHDYLLRPGFETALTPADTALKSALEAFIGAVDDVATSSPAWAVVEEMLRRLGDESAPR